jgi:hypothetical protein
VTKDRKYVHQYPQLKIKLAKDRSFISDAVATIIVIIIMLNKLILDIHINHVILRVVLRLVLMATVILTKI